MLQTAGITGSHNRIAGENALLSAGFPVEQMVAVSFVAFDFARSRYFETVFQAAVCFHFRHKIFLLVGNWLRSLGRQNHDHAASLELGLAFNDAEFIGFLSDAFQHPLTDIGMGDLPAAKPDGQFDFIPVVQKFDDITKLCLEVVLVNRRAEADFLNVDNLLVLAGLLFLLLHFVTILTVIHNPANRRFGGRSHIDQIQIGIGSDLQSFPNRFYAELLPIGSDQTNFPGTNLFVH